MREKVKESLFGSQEKVNEISRCDHQWRPRPAILFGYMEVEAQCLKCKTWSLGKEMVQFIFRTGERVLRELREPYPEYLELDVTEPSLSLFDVRPLEVARFRRHRRKKTGEVSEGEVFYLEIS